MTAYKTLQHLKELIAINTPEAHEEILEMLNPIKATMRRYEFKDHATLVAGAENLPSVVRAQAHYLLGAALFADPEIDDTKLIAAEAAFTQAVALNPTDGMSRAMLVMAHLYLKKVPAALETLQKAGTDDLLSDDICEFLRMLLGDKPGFDGETLAEFKTLLKY